LNFEQRAQILAAFLLLQRSWRRRLTDHAALALSNRRIRLGPKESTMKRLAIIFLLMASPAWAQSKPAGGHRADPCAPIGQTADGKLVYSMLCKNLPAPAPRVDAAAPAEAAAEPPPEEDKGGLFKFPLPGLIKPTYDQRPTGAAVQVR
jgi:hypothetical protein